MQKIFLKIAVSLSICTHAQNPTIDSLERALKAHRDDTGKVNTQVILSAEYFNSGEFTSAMQVANVALSLAREISYKKGKAEAYIGLGRIYMAMENYPFALNHFFKAISICEELENKMAIAYLNDEISNVYMRMHHTSEALKYRYKSLKIYEELLDTLKIANTFTQIGFYQQVMENYPESLDNLEIARRLFQNGSDTPGLALTYGRMAQLYRKMGNYRQSLKTDSLSLAIYKQLGNEWLLAWTLASMGLSIEFLYSGEKINETEEVKQLKFNESLKNYFTALDIFKKLGQGPSSYPVTKMHVRIGTVYIRLNNLKEARSFLDKSLELSIKSGNVENLSDSYKSLALLDSIQGNYKQAYLHFRKYLVYRDSLADEEGARQSLIYKMQYDSDKNELIAKAGQAKKDSEARRARNVQLFAIAVFLLLAIFFFISNRQKKKAKEKIELAYHELKSTQAQLIQSEKMASLGELTAGIAHEIQNPLNFVNNFSEVNRELIEEIKGEIEKGNFEEVKVIVNDMEANEEKISHHGKRAEAIVKSMLQHSRASSNKKEPTNINELADEYVRLAYHGLRAKDKSFNATINTDFDKSIGPINIIPQDIGRVFLNLINNALYVVDEKKKLEQDGYEPAISVRTKKLKGAVEISVSDNGSGIPQKVLDKIFQPFFTTKPTGQGTGLGLSLSYDIVKAHGGELRVETKEGDGTTFIMNLPHN